MRVESFIEALATMRLEDVFNPYTDRCKIYDKPNAPALRRKNLSAFLKAASIRPVNSIWIARDLGYRGGRRTGLPLTDEVHLPTFGQVFGGLKLHRATIGPPVAERTAAIVWRMLMCISVPVFLWNVFPFHPYLPGEPLSNRCHSARERRVSESFLTNLLDMLQPRHIVAIGGDAHRVVTALGCSDCYYVRHPSYGGQNAFIAGIAELYGCPTDADTTAMPSLFCSASVQA
jgi:Uracil DNA glycosylase superfamily